MGRPRKHPREVKGKNGGTLLPGRGRDKGVPNKTTRILKEAILLAAEAVGENGKGRDGLEGYLRMVARREVKSFCALLGRVLPIQLTGAQGGPIQIKDVSRAEVIDMLRERGIPIEQIFLPPPVDDVVDAEFTEPEKTESAS